jgi:hypothetical protein
MRQHLRIGRIVAAALGFAGAACSSQSWASTIVAPVDAFATSNFGPTRNDYSIENTIDQSGLSLAYTSGVTDFSSYFATNPTHTSVANHNEWFSQNYGIRRISGLAITYSFGALAAINGFALWNEEFAGIGTTQLLSSVDGITYTPLGTITPTPSTFAQGNSIIPYLAQIFSFDLTTMSSFRLLISNCAGQPGFRGCGIGEVAFSAVLPGQVSPVPLPAALPLLGSAIGFFVWLGRRRKNCN